MIQYINILNREGKRLLFRNYGNTEVDRDLLAGFLTAFSGFIKEISQEDISSTATDEYKYYYTLIDDIIIVVCTDLKDEDAVIAKEINVIRSQFIEKYKEILENGSWAGNRSVFADFERNLDDVVLGAIKISIIGTGGVGKTNILRLICGEDVDLEYEATINVDLTNLDGKDFGINGSIVLWDFAGQEY